MTIRYAASGRALFRAATFALVLPALAAAQQRPNGLLVGRVLSGDVAVPSAAIFVSGGRVTLARVDGRFRMSLPAGRYEVRAQRIGYTTGRDSVTIVAGDSSVVQIRVERSPVAFDAVAAVGTRGYERSAIDALAPVDVIDGAQLRATGRTGTSEALQAFSASINVPHNGTGDPSNAVHPFTMRAFGADEVLVLVNGKRRHRSALLNVSGDQGRGSSGTDADAIPLSLIDHVEILHGDATAQYGSDAIAGVVNIVLKSGVHGFAASTAGSTLTTYNRADDSQVAYTPLSRAASDGRTLQASIDKGVVWGERGFLHGGIEVRDRGATNRAISDITSSGTDPVERYGDASTHAVALYLNGGNLLHNGLELYGNLGGTRRRTDAFGQRLTFAGVPTLRDRLDDYSGTLGVRGTMDDWRWDLSSVLGRNKVARALTPAVNLNSGPTLAYLDEGAQALTQSTTNLELFRTVPLFDETRVTLGGELRHDAYTVTAGEPASYSNPAVTPDLAAFWWGSPAITPAQASSHGRTVSGAYLDAETDVNAMTTIGVAGRAEHYGDLGTELAGKLSLRVEPVRKLVFRGSVARGFRAPSIQQSTLALYLVNATNATWIAPPTSAQGAANGYFPLRAEHSLDLGLGVAMEVTPSVSFTVDLYRTDLNDRLVVSDVGVVSGAELFGFTTNGVSTRTDGLDATLSYAHALGTGTLRLSGGANLDHVSMKRVASVNTSFGPQQVLSFTSLELLRHGQPGSTLFGVANYLAGPLGAMLRVQNAGGVREAGYQSYNLGAGYGYAPGGGQVDPEIPRQTVVDASASLTLLRKYTLSAGADNLFDSYPRRGSVPPLVPTRLPYPYLTQSPLGFNGRFVYGKLSIYL